MFYNFFFLNLRRTLISFDSSLITNIAILGPYLYWIDKEKQAVERVDKYTGVLGEGSTVMYQTPHLMDIISIYIPTPEVIFIIVHAVLYTELVKLVKLFKGLIL